MSQGDTYRIVTPTVAIASLEEGRMIVTIPKSAVIEVVSSVMSIDRLVEIQWKDRRLVMFTQDLRERGRFLSNRNNLKRIVGKSFTVSVLVAEVGVEPTRRVNFARF
jgi:hypothetical protein